VIVVRALVFITVAAGLVAGAVPLLLLAWSADWGRLELGPVRFLGVPLAAAAGLVYLICVSDFLITGEGTPAFYDPPRNLVSGRLYQRVRNPMYLALDCLLLGQALYFESWLLLGYAALVAVGVHLLVVHVEEPALTRRFGPSYEAYRRSVPRWVPRPGPLPGRGAHLP
jgi:protein-S-isoprenylcysteine O-methyltransferase Ste14